MHDEGIERVDLGDLWPRDFHISDLRLERPATSETQAEFCVTVTAKRCEYATEILFSIDPFLFLGSDLLRSEDVEFLAPRGAGYATSEEADKCIVAVLKPELIRLAREL
jgi:hypothetical protein